LSCSLLVYEFPRWHSPYEVARENSGQKKRSSNATSQAISNLSTRGEEEGEVLTEIRRGRVKAAHPNEEGRTKEPNQYIDKGVEVNVSMNLSVVVTVELHFAVYATPVLNLNFLNFDGPSVTR
jgi:hypothetical protein